jgi:hypothetical protein
VHDHDETGADHSVPAGPSTSQVSEAAWLVALGVFLGVTVKWSRMLKKKIIHCRFLVALGVFLGVTCELYTCRLLRTIRNLAGIWEVLFTSTILSLYQDAHLVWGCAPFATLREANTIRCLSQM